MNTKLNYSVFSAPEKPLVGDRPRPFGETMAFDPMSSTLIYGEREAVLVDPLTTIAEAEALAAWVKLYHRQLTTIYITHGHMDHFAGVSVLLEHFPNARAISTPETLPFFSFLSGGFINLFAPSGGAQWAVQGPIMIEAAQQMGADYGATALGVAYGDQWTNAIQPFWIIPVLAISGIKLREVMGYLFLVLIFMGVVYGASILLLGFL